MIYKVGNSGHKIEIEKQWQVLDIGSGDHPHPRANVLVDRELGISAHRSGKAIKLDKDKLFVCADAQDLPFGDKSFDYVIASHIAEHVEKPGKFCQELMRVVKNGYIETPSKLCENVLYEPIHKFFVYKKGATLVFERKHKATGINCFYKIFYYGRERVNHSSITVSNKIAHLFFTTLNHALLRLWGLKPIRRLMYTCFDWKDSFTFEIEGEKHDA